MRIIDAHTHLGSDYNKMGWHLWFKKIDDRSAVEEFTTLGMDCIVTAPHPLITGQMDVTNEWSKRAIAQFPGKIYGYIFISPLDGMEAVKKQISRYKDNEGFLGIKFLTGYFGSLLQPEYEYAMDFADEAKCPVLVHEWGNIPDRNDFVVSLKNRHDMKLIIAHQGGGMAEDTKACAPIIRNYENAYMELCGSLDNQMPVEGIADLVGVDKLIFGTDQISLDPKYELGKVMFADLGLSDKEKIFSGNYLKLLEASCLGKIRFED